MMPSYVETDDHRSVGETKRDMQASTNGSTLVGMLVLKDEDAVQPKGQWSKQVVA